MSVRTKTKTSGGHRNFAYDQDSDAGSIKSSAKLGSQVCLSGAKAGEEIYKHQSMPSKILKGLMSIWSTRQMEDDSTDKDLIVKTTLRELIIYLFFLAILCVLTFGMTSPINYYYTNTLNSLFTESATSPPNGQGVTFNGMGGMGDYWDVMTGPMMDSLYWEKWYNDDNVTADQLGSIYFENKLLGLPRLRQVRVSPGSCKVNSKFQSTISNCYATYSSSAESKDPFGIYQTDRSSMNDTAFFYQSPGVVGGPNIDGTMATYNGGGYVKNLAHTKDDSTQILEYLKSNLWLDRGTRAVFLDFTVYNANINLFCQIRLTVEFPPTGGVMPSSTFRTAKLIRYVSSMDYFVLACEIIFIVFILYYTVEEALEIRIHKLSYFTTNFWNILDVVVILISYICIVFNLYRLVKVDTMLENLLGNIDSFPDFEFLCYWQLQFNNAIALTVFLSWIKIFKYISFNKTMTQLSATLTHCAKDVAGFAVMFYIVFFAYAQLGYLLFGSVLADYSTFPTALFTLFRVILGDFDFVSLEQASSVAGPIYFISYVFFVFFVLMNMFLAIINDTYSDVKADIDLQKSEVDLGIFFKERYDKVIQKMSLKRDKIMDIQNAMLTADKDNDKKLDFEEWRTELRARGYSDVEIEAFFAKYDTDGDRVLSEFEQNRIKSDLNAQVGELDKEEEKMKRELDAENENRRRIANNVSKPEFEILINRVSAMENSVGDVLDKIDAVLCRMESMEKLKIKRREAMVKILDSVTNSANITDDVKRHQLEQFIKDELEKCEEPAESSPRPNSNSSTSKLIKKY